MSKKDIIMGTIESSEPTDEELQDHWNGEGHLIFDVISYDSEAPIWSQYEIDWQDYSGCIGGLDETLGIQYSVNEDILGIEKLKLGYRYHLEGITMSCIPGDGWFTEDDYEYCVNNIRTEFILSKWLYAWWWHFIGHRIRNWRVKYATKF